MTIENFYKVGVESSVFKDLIDVTFDDSAFDPYFSFGVKIVDKAITDKDPFLASLFEVHPYTSGILRINADTVYNWHVDHNRGVSLNMFISGSNSHCLFTDSEPPSSEHYEMLNKVEELVYEPKRYYLLNTQATHCVINLNRSRFMFSLEFDEDKGHLSYHGLLSEVIRGDYDADRH